MKLIHCIAPAALLLALSLPARAGILTLNFDATVLEAHPGDTVSLTGTVTNNTADEVFLNGGLVFVDSPFSASDYSLSLLAWPPSVAGSGTSAHFEFVSVTVPSVFPVGVYAGTLVLQGGASDTEYSDLNAAADFPFAVEVTAAPVSTEIPEPGGLALLGLGAAMICARRRKVNVRRA